MTNVAKDSGLKRVKLANAENARVKQLYKEANTRLDEMGAIVGGALRVTFEKERPIQFGKHLTHKATKVDFNGTMWFYAGGECVGYYDLDDEVCVSGCD